MTVARFEDTMSEPNRALFSRVHERDIQLAFVQLVHTSRTFREWTINRFVPEVQPAEFSGISHSVFEYYGETDIELRFLDEQGNKHFILIECKVDAALGDDQVERYEKRGEEYVSLGYCDEAHIGLLAPQAYTTAGTTDFDGTITFGDIVGQLDTLDHDGVPYFRPLFEKAAAKKAGTDKTSPAERVNERILERLDEITSIKHPEKTLDFDEPSNRVKVWSNHPDHPDCVRYGTRFYFDERTMICGIGIFNVPNELHGRIYDVLAAHFEGLALEDAMTELSDDRFKSQGVVKKTIPIPSEPEAITDERIEEASAAVLELINHYHPKIVEVCGSNDQIG